MDPKYNPQTSTDPQDPLHGPQIKNLCFRLTILSFIHFHLYSFEKLSVLRNILGNISSNWYDRDIVWHFQYISYAFYT